MLEATIRKYQNRTIEAAQVIAELIELAKQMREGHKRGDKNTQAVFGDYIDVYDILQSKEDKATVPIYYEARLAKIDLKPGQRPKIGENHRADSPDPRREPRLRLEAYSWVTVS